MLCSLGCAEDFDDLTLTPNRRELQHLYEKFSIDCQEPNASVSLTKLLPNTLFVLKGQQDKILSAGQRTNICVTFF